MAFGNFSPRAIFLCIMFGMLSVTTAAFAQEQKDLAAMEANALNILDKHCSSCHQVGKTTGSYKERPAGNFGFVLDVDKLIAKNQLKPGAPNGSPLYVKMQSGEMPKGLSTKCLEIEIPEGTDCGPNANELKAVYQWIETLKDRKVEVARKFIGNDEIIAAMSQDLAQISEPIRPFIRYITLTNLYNAGDTDQALEGYRMALTKLVNSLSFESDAVTLVPIDEYKTVLRVNIKELGWTSKKWELIIAHNPYGVQYDDINFKTLQTATKTKQPFVFGEWLTFATSQPPLYHNVLGLPKKKRDLEKLLGLNVMENIKNFKVARAGFQKSGVSENNRLIERHTSRTGVYWESYDFAGNSDRQSFFKFPLGPSSGGTELMKKFGFKHDGGEVIFELPNGYHAYYLTDEKGDRINKGPQSIVTDPARRDRAVTNGVSCMGCHDKGIKYNSHRPEKKHDEVRPYIEQTSSLTFKGRDFVNEIYPPHDKFYQLMEADAKRYKAALESSGVKVGYEVDGMEIVNALFHRFERDLDLKLAAAYFGMSEKQFVEIADREGGEVRSLKQRLISGLVPRDQFINEYAKAVGVITRHKILKQKKAEKKGDKKVASKKEVKAEVKVVEEITFKGDKKIVKEKKIVVKEINAPVKKKFQKTFDLIFYPVQSHYVKGQYVNFVIKSEKSCYLTILNIPEKGKTTVIFPNKYNPNNLIKAGTTYAVPGRQIKGFKFKFAHTGYERVIAICNASRPDPHGVKHDFTKHTFTSYENYTQVITRSFADRKKSRQIIVEKSGPNVSKLKTDREKKFPALVKNFGKDHVDIEARKAVLLLVKDH